MATLFFFKDVASILKKLMLKVSMLSVTYFFSYIHFLLLAALLCSPGS